MTQKEELVKAVILTEKEALVRALILEFLLERYHQGETSVSQADVLTALGTEPSDADYETSYQLTDKFFEMQFQLFAELKSAAGKRH